MKTYRTNIQWQQLLQQCINKQENITDNYLENKTKEIYTSA